MDRLTAKKDSTPTEEYDLEEIANEISKAFGVPIQKSQALVDQYRHYAWFALAKVKEEIAAGKNIQSPFAIMHVKLRSGEIQSEVAAGMWELDEPEPDPEVEYLRKRYENAQAGPFDTAAKRLGDGITLAELEASAAKKGLVSLECGHFVENKEGAVCRCGNKLGEQDGLEEP